MNAIGVGATLAIVLGLLAVVTAQHPDSMRSSLRGVGEIERKLRRVGMAANPTVFDTDKRVSGLVVQLDVRCSELVPVCAVGTGVRFNQDARLMLSGYEMVAVTWHAEETSILPFEKMSEAFSGLDRILDRLVADWQTANNKKAS